MRGRRCDLDLSWIIAAGTDGVLEAARAAGIGTLPRKQYGTADTFPSVKIEPHLAATDAPASLLTLERVEKRYGAFRPALVDISLSIARGEFLVVRGPGASGKSTLLRLLAGLESPTGGTVRLAGEDVARMRAASRVHLRRSMGILPSGDSLLDRHSVLHNVALAAWIAGTPREESLRRARAALDLVGVDVERYGAAPCTGLAAGVRHRVAIARALVNRPALLLLDDVVASLDQAAAAHVLRVIDQFTESGVTVVATDRIERQPENVEKAQTPTSVSANLEALPPAGAASPWPARARAIHLHDGKIVS